MVAFKLFGLQHLVALLLVALLSAVSFQVGRGRLSDRFNLFGALFFVVYGVWLWAYKLSDGIDWQWDLPLQLCDLVYLLCLASFWKPRPALVTLATYWGLGGTVQALLTPDLQSGFPSSEFLIFFVGHSAVVWAVFFLLGRAPHPGLVGMKGWRTSFFGLLGYVGLAGTVNYAFELNYGYLREKPAGASVLDLMGPWPLYVLNGLGIAAIIFGVLSIGLKLLPLEGRNTRYEPG